MGEICEQVLGYRERQRREHQVLAVIAVNEACYFGHVIAGEGKLPEIYEAFPFWTEEEIKEAKLEKYRRIMERYAAKGGG